MPAEPYSSPMETAEECLGSEALSRRASFLYEVLDCERPYLGGGRFELSNTDEVLIGRSDRCGASREVNEGLRRLVLTAAAPTLSSKHCRLLRVGDAWAIQDRGSRNGTWLNTRSIAHAELSDGDLFQVGRSFYLFRRHQIERSSVSWPDVVKCVPSEQGSSLESLNPILAQHHDALKSIAKSKLGLLLLGGTGTGKEVCARAVHALSKRTGQFFPVNCGAIPSGLVESTLFGHVKGAFSGAISNQDGFIRAAHGGTLFLDEIGDLPLAAQATLLRVLQQGEVTPVGATQAIPVDVRVIAATHQPLEELVSQKRFREDLFARLAGYVHRLWLLESRTEDFGSLFALLLRRAVGNSASRVTLTTEAGWALLRHPWPMNVRELEQSIARAVVLADHGQLGLQHFSNICNIAPRLQHSSRPPSGLHVKTPTADIALRVQLDDLMREHRGNVAAVARALGKGPTQIQRWLKRVGLAADRYRT